MSLRFLIIFIATGLIMILALIFIQPKNQPVFVAENEREVDSVACVQAIGRIQAMDENDLGKLYDIRTDKRTSRLIKWYQIGELSTRTSPDDWDVETHLIKVGVCATLAGKIDTVAFGVGSGRPSLFKIMPYPSGGFKTYVPAYPDYPRWIQSLAELLWKRYGQK